jgi:hypothetical protein
MVVPEPHPVGEVFPLHPADETALRLVSGWNPEPELPVD